MSRKIIKGILFVGYKMEIKDNFRHINEIDKLIPKLNDFENHFLLIDKLQEFNPSLELLDQAEKSWKEIENFEFQKMDVKKSFEQLLRRI